LNPPMQVGPDGKPLPGAAPAQGGALAMTQSNRNSAALRGLPKGNGQGGANMQGPM